MDEILSTLVEGLSLQNQRLNDIDVEIQGTQKEVNDFENEYSKEKKIIHDRIDAINIQIDKIIKDYIKTIPKVKDGVDGRDGRDFDYEGVKLITEGKINQLIADRNLETTKIKEELRTLINDIEIPKSDKGDKGEDGKDVSDAMVQEFVSNWLITHKEEIQGEDGRNGLNGRSGEDGRSIIDVTVKNNIMTIHFSDDTTKEIKLPKQVKYLGGGGSSTVSSEETVIIANSDTTLQAISQTVIASTDIEDMLIQLPSPTQCYKDGKSCKIAISKTDNTDNSIIISSPSGKVAGFNTLSMLDYGDVATLITDGTDWYFASHRSISPSVVGKFGHELIDSNGFEILTTEI